MKFVLPRNRVYASTLGHAINFQKGVPVHVPPELYDEVLNIGAAPEEELPEPTKVVSKEPTDPIKRRDEVFTAMELVILRNKREDFTAGNAPHAKVLSAELGWTLDARERDLLWEKFQQRDKE